MAQTLEYSIIDLFESIDRGLHENISRARLSSSPTFSIYLLRARTSNTHIADLVCFVIVCIVAVCAHVNVSLSICTGYVCGDSTYIYNPFERQSAQNDKPSSNHIADIQMAIKLSFVVKTIFMFVRFARYFSDASVYAARQ